MHQLKMDATKRRRYWWCLSQRGDDRTKTHFLRESMRRLDLLIVKNANQRPRGNRKLVNGRAVERNRDHPMADATHKAFVLGLRLAVTEFAQGRLDRHPIALLRGRELQRTLDPRDINRGGWLAVFGG